MILNAHTKENTARQNELQLKMTKPKEDNT